MTGSLEHFITRSEILKDIQDPHNRRIMIIGMSDTGKTTLTEYLADHLSKRTDVGIIDLDMGQSHISMPTTVAWGKIEKGFKSWKSIMAEDYYFTGALSPVGSLLPSVTGAKLMTDKASASCQKVIVDTTGLTSGPIGRALKQYKIDILSPDIILALQHDGELSHILDSFRSQTSPKIYNVPVPDKVASKNPAKRSLYRHARFKSYFTGAQTYEVSYENRGIRFTRDPVRFTSEDMKKRIVSFRDTDNRDIGLGIIEEVYPGQKKLLVRSPMPKKTIFSTIVFGTAHVEL